MEAFFRLKPSSSSVNDLFEIRIQSSKNNENFLIALFHLKTKKIFYLETQTKRKIIGKGLWSAILLV